MNRVLIISQDVVGPVMAGPGIRYWELARTLADEFAVTLLAREPSTAPPPGVALVTYAWGDAAALRRAADAADGVVVSGFVLGAHPVLGDTATPLLVDMYDPFPLENLARTQGRGGAEQQSSWQDNQDMLGVALARGDAFLCATPRQRDLWIGALLATGRITPALIDLDPLLLDTVFVLASGLPAEPPVPTTPRLKGVWPGVAATDRVIVWTGGLWDWLDPLTLIEAMPAVVAAQPDARLVFLGGGHPTEGVAEAMQMPQRAQRLAEELGLLGRVVFFNQAWLPYAERGAYLREAEVAVSLHHHGLESSYAAVRSRVLDHLWAGLPSVLSQGDAASAWLGTAQAAALVAPGAVDEVATALIQLLGDPTIQQRMAAAAQELAHGVTWARVSLEARSWLRTPRRTSPLERVQPVGAAPVSAPPPAAPVPAPAPAPAALATVVQAVHQDHQRAASIHQLETLWAAQAPTPPLVQARQRLTGHNQQLQYQFNGALLHALYGFAESSNVHKQILLALTDTIGTLTARLSAADDERTTLAQQLADMHTQMLAAQASDEPARLLALETHVRGLDAHTQTLATQTADEQARLLGLETHVRGMDARGTGLFEHVQVLARDGAALEDVVTNLATLLTLARLPNDTSTPSV